MTIFMTLLTISSKSRQLVEKNKLFYNELSRFFAYIFSPTIRKNFSIVDFSKERLDFIGFLLNENEKSEEVLLKYLVPHSI